jgi:hypothetical protein
MSLVARYKLDGNALDSSGNGYDGTVENLSTTQSGLYSDTYLFSVDPLTRVIINDILLDQVNENTFSISGWVYPQTSVDDSYIVGQLANGSDNGVRWIESSEKLLIFITESADTNNRTRSSSNGSVPVNVWTNFCVIIDGLSIKIFINGILDAEFTETISIALWNSKFNLGSRTTGQFHLDGMIQDVQIYDHALSAKEVEDVYLTPVLHLDFNEDVVPTKNYITNQEFTGYYGTGAWTKTGPDDEGWMTVHGTHTGNNGIITFVQQPNHFMGADTSYSIEFVSPNNDVDITITGYQSTSVYTIPGTYFYYGSLIHSINDHYNNGFYFRHIDHIADVDIDVTFKFRRIQTERLSYPTSFVEDSRLKPGYIVDKSGWDNNVILPIKYGPELNTSPETWNLETGWANNGDGSYHSDGTGTNGGAFYKNLSTLDKRVYYEIKIENYVSGTVTISTGTVSPEYSGNGVYLLEQECTGSGTIYVQHRNTLIADISVSVKEAYNISDFPISLHNAAIGSQSYHFDGTDDYIDVSEVFRGTNNNITGVTYNVWVNVNSISVDMGIIGSTLGSGYSYYSAGGIWIDNGKLEAVGYDINIPEYKHVKDTVDISINEWIMATCVWDSTAQLLKLYKNGILIDSQTCTTLTTSTNGITRIGHNTQDTSQMPLNGMIDDPRIYPFALTTDQVQKLYQTKVEFDSNGNVFAQGEILDYEYQALQDGYSIDSITNKINLIKNGSFNNNINDFELTGHSHEPNDGYTSNGCLKITGNKSITTPGDKILINPNDTYKVSLWAKSVGSGGLSRLYAGINPRDSANATISQHEISHDGTTETTLAQDLNNGDTTIYLTDMTNWYDGEITYRMVAGFWFEDEYLNPYPIWTRATLWTLPFPTSVDIPSATITIPSWSGGHVPAGTHVANMYASGGSYQYCVAASVYVPDIWTYYEGFIYGTQTLFDTPRSDYDDFRYSTSNIYPILLSNYTQDDTYELLIDDYKIVNMTNNQTVDFTNIIFQNSGNIIGEINEIGPTDGLIGYWPLNGHTDDYSGNGNDGVNVGSIVGVGLKSKKSYSFDGTGTIDGLVHGSNIEILETITGTDNYTNGCTYSFWINVDTDAVNRMALLRGEATFNHIEIYTTGKYFRTEASLQNGYSFGTGVFPDNIRGDWGHFVIVFANAESGRPVRWYQNGTLFHTGSLSGGTYPDTEHFSFSSIGRSTGTVDYNYSPSFDGNIQDVRIYNRALTAKEIKTIYNMYDPTKTNVIQMDNSLYVPNDFKESY